MTGSAFAILIARGTLCTGFLRRITYYITNCAREHGVPDRTGAGGWRMTGSAGRAGRFNGERQLEEFLSLRVTPPAHPAPT